jgi:hypothetical protein
VADDYRITIEFEDEGSVLHFGRLLSERELERELRERLGDGVVVTRNGHEVFLYAGSLEQARAAEKAVREALEEHEMQAGVSPILRWHPVEERWEDVSTPLPQTDEQLSEERRRRDEQQTREAEEEGYGDWEVRIDLPSHGDAVELAERLEGEGIAPLVRRWKYILIGTATEDEARALAKRLEDEVPAGATVKAEVSAAVGWELTSQNPWAIFGGFGPGPQRPA